MYCFCRASRTIAIRIFLLDESEFLHEIQSNLSGQALLEVVFARLNLIETAYFGLRYLDVDGQTHWLDANARISRQLRESKDVYELYFGVKFYAVDPCKLLEEITRYQFYLQVKQDVFQGRLPVAFDLATQLGAYVVQTELGDFDANKHSYGYVSEFRLINNQTKELELRVADNHRHLKGLSSAQAEFNYLDKVKWLDMYGVDLHPVLGEDSVEYFLGLTPSGIIVLRNKTTVAHYYWPRIAKVYFKGRYFMLRVCDKNNEISTYGFETPKKTACKHLWKCCVEHHAFFRLVRVSPMSPQAGPGDFFSLGSRFRYSGRTERQASKDAMVNKRNQPAFTRTPSRRQIRRSFDDTQEKKYSETNHLHKYEIKNVSIPQQAQPIESPYKSTCSIPGSLNNNSKHSYRLSSVLDSPRSTRSAPWIKTQQRGLFGINSSPKSVRSATSRNDRSNSATNHRQRSSSVESHSSNDSKSTRRHRNRSKRMSDNESEMSRGSARSGRSHNSQHRKHRRHRSRHRSRDSEHGGSEHGSNYTYNDKYSVPPELVDSGKQWLEVQRQQAEKNSMGSVQKASVIKSTVPNVASTDTYNRKHKHRKHRSPSDHSNKIWSTELTKHLQFDLVETSGMTEDQLREIPYTVVETQQGRRRPNTNSLKVHKSSYGGKNAERVDRIRGLQNTEQLIDGSIRSGSTNSSSRDFDRNADIMRMMTSLSMGDFISPNVSNLNRVDSNGLRVSHEHTDSGLGADQDYAYSSERSSDSAKYGTNKSSGASVVSANIGNHPSSTNHHHQQAGSRKALQYNQRHNISSTTITTAPVHTKSIHSYDSNFNRLINNNHTHSPGVHYTFSLSRLGQGLHGVDSGVGNHVSISSPYNGYGVEQIRGTKSDVGGKLAKTRSTHSTLQVPKLPSVKSDLSIFENSFKDSSFFISDRINNNQPGGDNFHGKSGSKLLYNNKHRMEQNMANNNHQSDLAGGNIANSGNNGNSANINNNKGNNVNMVTGGPLMYVNRDKKYCRRTNTVHNNNSAVQSSSDGLSGLTSSVETLDSPNNPSNSRNNSKTSSLELILSPIIQSRRAQL